MRALTVGVVIALSLGINLAFRFVTPPTEPQHDAKLYDTTARLLVGFGPADKSPEENRHAGLEGAFHRGITYPSLIALIYTIGAAPNYAVVLFIQAFILPLTVLLTYFFGCAVFNHRIALMAAVLYALYLPAVWHTNFLLTETLLALLFTLTMLMMMRYINDDRPPTALLFGFCVGLMGVSHAAWLVLPAVVLAAFYLRSRKSTASRWSAVRRLAFVVLGVVAVLAPFNAVRLGFGLPQLGGGGTGLGTGASGGFTFYVGSRAETRGLTVPIDYVVVETYFPPGRLRELYEEIQRGEASVEPILLAIIKEKLDSPDPKDWVLTDFDYYRAGIENWFDKPWQIPYLLAAKTYWFLLDMGSSPTYPLEYSTLHTYEWRVFFKYQNWPVVLLMLIGFWVFGRQRRHDLVIFVPFAFQILIVLAVYPDNRYKYPVLSSLFLLTSFAAFRIAGTLKGQSVRKLLKKDKIEPPRRRDAERNSQNASKNALVIFLCASASLR